MIPLRVIGVMLGCYALPYLFLLISYLVGGDTGTWAEASDQSIYLLIVLIYLNTRPWKE